MNVWWEFAVKFLPLWMAPNLVTLLGFLGILSTTLTLLFFIPEFNSVAPQWAYFLALLGHFFYQTMDAIDGKQVSERKRKMCVAFVARFIAHQHN
jgi:phosphatidylglycerophosphate synthase